MKPCQLFLPLVGVLLCLLEKGLAMDCFQCNSNEHADCQEYFDHPNLKTLTVRPTECGVDSTNYCIKTTGVWGGIVGTTRFCSSRDMGNECKFVTYPDHDRTYRACIYTCGTNNCNTAGHTRPYLLPTFIVATLTLISTCLR